MSTSTGKIGRLPAKLRGKINRMLYDNRPAKEILAFLEEEGVTDVSPQNLSSWKAHGYQGWLRIRRRLEEMQLRRESARVLAEAAAGGDDGEDSLNLASNASAYLATDTIQEVLEDFNPETLKDLLAEKPAKFMQLVEALERLRRGDQSFIKLQMQHREFQARMRTISEEARRKADASGNTDLKALAEAMDQALG